MLVFSLLATVVGLAAGAAVPFTMPINTKYATVVNGICTPAMGYSWGTGDSDPGVPIVEDVAPNAAQDQCVLQASKTLAIFCAAGYNVQGLPTNMLALGADTSDTAPAGVAYTGTAPAQAVTAVVVSPTDLGTTTTLTCVNGTTTSCTWTCSGNGCTNATGSVPAGETNAAACMPGYAVNTTETCTVNGTFSAVLCVSAADQTSSAAWTATNQNSGVPFSQLPTRCNCATNPTCRSSGSSVTTPVCSKCFSDSGCSSTSGRQALVGAAGVTCPNSATVDDARRCFRVAACSGVVNSGMTCFYGGLSAACPNCDDSKKGLLGLLGLLGLIPLLLCSLLLCCLLLACRRKKAGAPQHMGTFDQPTAAHMEVPVTHCGPMVGSVGPGVYGGPIGPTVF